MTSLSEGGTIVPGTITICGMFIESTELEKTSHVIGSHMTLGYSIADFINVFQVRQYYKMSCDKRKRVFGISDFQVKHKQACAAKEDC